MKIDVIQIIFNSIDFYICVNNSINFIDARRELIIAIALHRQINRIKRSNCNPFIREIFLIQQ
ncbi:hypothetical protein DF044_29115 [Burkholderia contaminans]|nr:hypothetical protein C6Q17_04665 [Burkholderia contaminans]RQT06723.1 hypothetical protein DF044_29115 [Burkholderia contaminans]